jgi:uncharacterized protein YkwD
MRAVAFVAMISSSLVAAPPRALAKGSELPAASVCAGAEAATAAAATEVASMRCLVNWVRARHGLPPIRESSQLDRSSGLRAGAIRRCGDFSHTPCGQPFEQPFVRAGYLRRSGLVGENLAWGGSSLGSPRATLASWLRSPPHRANLLRPGWRDFGLVLARGQLFGNESVSLWVLQFGRR